MAAAPKRGTITTMITATRWSEPVTTSMSDRWLLQRLCNMHAPHLQHTCNMHAPHLQHICNMHAPHLQHICNMHAPHLQHICSIAMYTVTWHRRENLNAVCYNWHNDHGLWLLYKYPQKHRSPNIDAVCRHVQLLSIFTTITNPS